MLSGLKALLRGFGLVGDGVSIHNTHVMNTVRPLCSKILDHKVPLIPPLLQWRCLLTLPLRFAFGLPPSAQHDL